MKKFPIGIQLYSLRNELAENFEATINKLAEFGYDAVETAGLYDRSPEEFRAVCDAAGLEIISAHVGRDELYNDSSCGEKYQKLGCKYIGVGYGPIMHAGGPEFERGLEMLRKISSDLKKYGIDLMYHNHDWEFEYLDGYHKLDILYSTLAPDILKCEIDTCWAKVAGEDPANYILKYKGRLPLLHVKDFSGLRHCWANPETFAIETSYYPKKPYEYRPIGYGEQNIPNLLAAAEKAEVKYLIVEQDEPSLGKTPLECAKLSVNYIKSILG